MAARGTWPPSLSQRSVAVRHDRNVVSYVRSRAYPWLLDVLVNGVVADGQRREQECISSGYRGAIACSRSRTWDHHQSNKERRDLLSR